MANPHILFEFISCPRRAIWAPWKDHRGQEIFLPFHWPPALQTASVSSLPAQWSYKNQRSLFRCLALIPKQGSQRSSLLLSWRSASSCSFPAPMDSLRDCILYQWRPKMGLAITRLPPRCTWDHGDRSISRCWGPMVQVMLCRMVMDHGVNDAVKDGEGPGSKWCCAVWWGIMEQVMLFRMPRNHSTSDAVQDGEGWWC